jgi:AraC-like DNA-binding protein
MGGTNMDLRETHIVGQDTRERLIAARTCKPLGVLNIHLAGLSEAKLGFRFIRRDPDFSQLLLCEGGWGEVLVDGKWLRCSAGMGYLTPPGALHAYHAVKGVTWNLCWAMYIENEARQPIVASKVPVLIEIDPQPLSAAIEGLYRESVGPADIAFMHQWAHLVDAYARRTAGPLAPEAWLWRLWETVDADLARSWNVQELSRRAGISSEHLRRLCHQQMGRSPMKHVAYLRMRRAAALLGSGSYSIDEVSRLVGYDNAFAFSTAFKRTIGASPSAYRKKSRLAGER